MPMRQLCTFVAAAMLASCGGGASNIALPPSQTARAPISAGTPNPATCGPITEFAAGVDEPFDIVAAPDGALWYTSRGETTQNMFAHMTEGGVVSLTSDVGQPLMLAWGPDGRLWFTNDGGQVDAWNPSTGALSVYTVPSGEGAFTNAIVAGPDGNMWFTELGNSENVPGRIGRISMTGTVTEYDIAVAGAQPNKIIVGPDGNLWANNFNSIAAGKKLYRISTAGAVTVFTLSGTNVGSDDLTAGPDGAIWFTDRFDDQIGRFGLDSSTKLFPLAPGRNPWAITTGSDGALYFTERGGYTPSAIARMTTTGVVTEYRTPTNSDGLLFITNGRDRAVWFTDFSNNLVGRLSYH